MENGAAAKTFINKNQSKPKPSKQKDCFSPSIIHKRIKQMHRGINRIIIKRNNYIHIEEM